LDEHGFEWDGRVKYSPDHVLDLAWGGKDAFHNLWPLDTFTNSAAGRLHNFQQFVEFRLKTDPEDEVKRAPLSEPYFLKKFFKINEIRDP
jgi:hypothetical protein